MASSVPAGRSSALLAPASTYVDELAFAVAQARRAGALLMESYGRVERVDHKSARDVVTEVDVASEELIISAIRERFPGDAILAEESGEHQAVGEARAASGRTWVIDPLDGTVNYANAIPFFCVSIALVVDGVPSVAVIFDPARDDCLSATRDGPSLLDGEPTSASTKEALSDFVVALAIVGRGGLAKERAIARAIRIPRRMGSASLSLAYVGCGRFDGYVQNGGLSLWDVAAAGLIAERAGATVTDLAGGPWYDPARVGKETSVLAAPAPHHARLLELVRETGTRVRARS